VARYVAVAALILTSGIVVSRGGADLENERLPSRGALPEAGLVELISKGEPVDVESRLEAEGYAVVEFKADW
jgi:hypothetical protein